VDTSFALWKQKQNAAMVESKGAGTHGGNQVGIGINDNHAHPTRDATHKSRAEHVTGSHGKHLAKDIPGQQAAHDKRVDVALVIRRNDERPVIWKLFQAGCPEFEAVARHQLDQPENQKQESCRDWARLYEVKQFTIGAFLGQNGIPSWRLSSSVQ